MVGDDVDCDDCDAADDVGCRMAVMELLGTAELADCARGCWKVVMIKK